MKKENPPPKPPGKRSFTYRVRCSFETQHTFTEAEVEQDSESGEGDFSPTEDALKALEQEFTELLGYDHAVIGFNAFADFDDLLGATDEQGNDLGGNARPDSTGKV